MSAQQWNFDKPDRFIVGTIGAPGEREFYFQVRQGAYACTGAQDAFAHLQDDPLE